MKSETVENNSVSEEPIYTEEEKSLIMRRRAARKGLEHVGKVVPLIVEECTYLAAAYTYKGTDEPESLRLDVSKFADLLNKAQSKYVFSKKGWQSGGELLCKNA